MLEIIKEISIYKEYIKKSSKNILAKLNDSNVFVNIDNEILDILDDLGNIGMLTHNQSGVTDYAKAWNDAIRAALEMDKRIGMLLVKRCLDQICMTSFWIDKKGKNYEIKLPDINLLKL